MPNKEVNKMVNELRKAIDTTIQEAIAWRRNHSHDDNTIIEMDRYRRLLENLSLRPSNTYLMACALVQTAEYSTLFAGLCYLLNRS